MSGLTENHPLEPFLPGNAILLMLGSFPPQKKRWSMDFFYPNWSNDMWRIFGLVFFNQKDYFVVPDKKAFDKERIIEFLKEKGIALYDTACVVKRNCGAYRHRFAFEATPRMPGNNHYRRKSHRYDLYANAHRKTVRRKQKRIRIRRPPASPLPDAFFQPRLSA